MNIISERTRKDDRIYELVEDQIEYLRDLNTYLPKFMIYLWEQPKIVSFIINHSDINELKEHLAPFFANNFYENILSPYYIEDNLMYVLTLLLQEEINNLNNINQSDNFLNNTPCGCLLEELRRKNDIQSFFKTIIFDDVQNLEVNYSSTRLKFKINNLNDDFKKRIKQLKNHKIKNKDEYYTKSDSDSLYSISSDDGTNIIYRNKEKMKKDLENFNVKYIPLLNKDELKKFINKYKDNKNMYDFCNSKLNGCKSDDDLYSNKKLLDNLYDSKYSKELLVQYQVYFNIVISFIDSIIDKIINNLNLLPYSVKCLCKIISILITKKFPSINKIEKNAFISKFLFGKLLIPILKNPGIEAFINNFIISRNTTKNLSLICLIIKKLVSGQFYTSSEDTSDYTPYNWYFIEKMEKLFKIFDNMTKVKLPSFLEKYINEELPEDYEYNYFNENQEEVINHRSICFNLEQVKILLNTMNKFKNQIFVNPKNNGLMKTLEKLLSESNQELFNKLLNQDKNNIIQEPLISQKLKKKEKDEKENVKPKLHFFLLTTLLTNEKYEKLFNIEQETANFSIKELKISPENEIQNNIIKVKNFFCSLLYNYNKLKKTDFDEGTTENTEKILKELSIFMKSTNFVVDGSIPSEWYVNALLEYLKKIPDDLTKNDCENLYSEIESDINKSIKELDFEAISVIIGKLKYARRDKIYYEGNRKLLIDIKINEEIQSIIEKDFIPVEIKFHLNEDIEKGEFEIYPSNFKEKDRMDIEKIKEHEKSKKIRLCTTIEEFTKKFPNLSKYQEFQDADIFEIQKRLQFPTKIDRYLKIISLSLEKKRIVKSNKYSQINQKIYDYLMSKIYDKIYPCEPYEKDNRIFQQSIRLSWTEPNHFINAQKKLIFGSFLSDFLKYYNLIDTEKSPRKKMSNMNEIFNSIGFLLKFNGVKFEGGVDDQLPILNYAFIKAQPLRMFSNAKFMELYIGNLKSKYEGSQLTQILSICNYIIKIKYSDLFNVSNEEFFKKCDEATTNDISSAN